MASLLLPVVVLLSLLSLAAAQFNFSLYPNPFGSVETNIALLLAPVGPVGAQTGAPGDILVFGGSYDGAIAVQPVANTALLNTSLAAIAITNNFDGIPPAGEPGCAARTGSVNQLYSIGVNSTVNPQTEFSSLQYYVYRSNDGVNWTNVLDAASQRLFLDRPDDDLTRCGVDLQGNVYDIGSATTYISSNQGVTWTAVPLTGSRFANRTSFAGGIFTSAITQLDTLIVIGGRVSPVPGGIYGGADFNDVWTSSNGGASWTQVTAAAPWSQRDSLSWAYSNGVHVIYGGTQEGGFGLYYGDLWASVDDGATWLLLANQTAAGDYSNTALIFDPYGYLYLFGGETAVNGSNGYTWSSVEARSTVPVGSVAQLSAVLAGSSSSSTAGAPSLSSSASSASPSTASALSSLPSTAATSATSSFIPSSSSGFRGSGAATTHAAHGLALALLLAAVMSILL